MDIKKSTAQNKKAALIKTHNSKKQKLWIGTYVVLGLLSLLIYFLFKLKFWEFESKYGIIISKLLLAAATCFAILIISRIIKKIITKRSHTVAVKYNLLRLINLITTVIVVFIFISYLNSNWYTAAVSLGLISLLLGFALQTPIASLIGWFYIVIRTPYKVGDRIQVADFTGDVVEINYFDTTLWEFAGNYMSNDLPSGRLIRFPNSLVFQDQIYNYSWKKFPYIWNEIPFHVAYQSDLDWIENIIKKIAKEQLGPGMEEHVLQLRQLIQETPVDELEVKEYPFVNFRINANTWVEVLVVYLVDPKNAASVRTNLIRKILQALNAEPEKAMLPKADNR